MPSTNARPSSIRPSRSTQNRVNAQIVRSASAPQQQFIMILTSNPILLQNTRAFQPPVISTWLLLRDFYFNYDYHFVGCTMKTSYGSNSKSCKSSSSSDY
ncbi:unnamed protein product [Rotaria socialis]|uniref:Uncharacterized protein n=1 Tax=Rotaria socialis TaxID=392032 RepID=A0A818RZJ2_9BILA|nr:unnamed protein product [Rotaria socialis]